MEWSAPPCCSCSISLWHFNQSLYFINILGNCVNFWPQCTVSLLLSERTCMFGLPPPGFGFSSIYSIFYSLFCGEGVLAVLKPSFTLTACKSTNTWYGEHWHFFFFQLNSSVYLETQNIIEKIHPFLDLGHFKLLSSSSMCIWLLRVVVCLKPFPSDRVKLPSADHRHLTGGKIACIYIVQKNL